MVAPGLDPDGVLYVSATGGYGGPVASLVTLLGCLDDVDRVVCAPRPAQDRYWARLAAAADTLVEIPRPRGPALPRAQAAVLRAVRRHRSRVSLLHANSLTELAVTLPAAQDSRLPVVVWVHNWEVPTVARLAAPWVRRMGDRIHFAGVSSLTRDLAVGAGLTTAERFTIIPNPIDEHLVGRPVAASDDRVRIGFLGRGEHRKGFDVVPRCVEALRDEPVHWSLWSNPFTDHRDLWRQLLAETPGLVEVQAMVSDVAAAYARCDIVFVPSRLESFCRVAAEAMANGVPVVAFDLEPLRDLLGDDEAGLLVPVDDVPAAVDALRRLVHDPTLRARLGTAGRERAAAFTPAGVAGAMQALYGQARRRVPSPR